MIVLRKDASIWTMIAGVMQRLDSHELDVIDHWDATYDMIGFARVGVPNRLVFVSTCQQPAGHYAFDLEVDASSTGEKQGMGTGEQGVTIDVLVEVVKRHLEVPAAAPSTEYDASSIHKLNVPRWERLADGSFRRLWEIRFARPIADEKLTVFAGLSEPSIEVDATFSDDRRTVTLVTTTTSSTPYSDDVFYGAPYRMMRALDEAVGAIELIQGQPRDLWQPFRRVE